MRVQKKESSSCSLEVQVVDVADSITYDSHDTDDAVALDLVTLDQLLETTLLREAAERVRHRWGHIDDEMLRKSVVHEIIDLQVGDVLTTSIHWLEATRPCSAEAVSNQDFALGPSPDLTAKKAELESFLHHHVYRHKKLVRERSRAQRQLCEMFQKYVTRAELLPSRFRTRAEDVGLERSVGDYLAGMADRYCQFQYWRLFHSGSGGGSPSRS